MCPVSSSQGWCRKQGHFVPCILIEPSLSLLGLHGFKTRGVDTAARQRRAVGAHLSTHPSFFFVLTLLSASSSECARLLSLPPFLPPLVLLLPIPPHAAAGRTCVLPLPRLPSVSFLFKKKSENAAKSIAHRNKQHASRNTHRATRITQHATRITQHATRITHHATRNTQHATRIAHRATRIVQHEAQLGSCEMTKAKARALT